MRVAVTAYPMFGHVNTVLPLASAAERAGHDVVVCTGADFVPHVERLGLAARAVGQTYEEAGGAPRSPVAFIDAAERRTADLVAFALSWKADLIVSEESELAGLAAALSTTAAYVTHGLGIAAMGSAEVLGAGVDELGRRLRMPELRGAYSSATYLTVCPPSLSPEGWPDRADVRPVRPASGPPSDGDQLPASLDGLPHPQTVHLTLGTVFHTAPGVLATALAGLASLPVNIVVTTGSGAEPEVPSGPAHVVVEAYLPHALLLPRCDLVVSQGGAGVLLGALAHGLPELVLPLGADQFANAEAVRHVRAGLVLQPDEVTPDSVAAAAETLLNEAAFRDAAGRMEAEIASMPAAGDVMADLVTHPPARIRRA